MKTERKLSELLQIMLDNKTELGAGLCLSTSFIYISNLITESEKYELIDYIKNNRPSIFSSFDAFYCKVIVNSNYYWSNGKIEPRIKWLNKHIKKQKRIEKTITSFTITRK